MFVATNAHPRELSNITLTAVYPSRLSSAVTPLVAGKIREGNPDGRGTATTVSPLVSLSSGTVDVGSSGFVNVVADDVGVDTEEKSKVV